MNNPKLIRKVLKNRHTFLTTYNKTQQLLEAFEKNEFTTAFRNPSKKIVRANKCNIFYTLDKIKNQISLQDNELPSRKVEKIFNFVKTRMRHTYPLYGNTKIHNAPRFFSVYGCGFCHNAAANMIFLAYVYGFEGRVWQLHEHLVADIRYDGVWHVYDPDPGGLGIIYSEDGEVADMNHMISLAKFDKLNKYNEAYKRIENNKIMDNNWLFPNVEADNPYMEFLPGENRYFYDKTYMLTTDGRYLKGPLSSQETFHQEYDNTTANYIREIPLNKNTIAEDTIILRDYFPLAGIFLYSPDSTISPEDREQVMILAVSDSFRTKQWLPASEFPGQNLRNQYSDLTLGINNIEPYPSYSVQIKNTGGLIQKYRDLRLIAVYCYCYANAQFERRFLEPIRESGILVEIG